MPINQLSMMLGMKKQMMPTFGLDSNLTFLYKNRMKILNMKQLFMVN